jgi:hypothetical protein
MDIFVYGLFTDENKATTAVTYLEGAGFDAEHISALMQVGSAIDEEHPRFKVAMGRGAALGAALGTMGGALIAVSGFLIAAPLTLSMAGGISGAAFGLLGGLSHWTENVDLHDHVANGMILVGAFVDELDDMAVERARSALAMAHPEHIHMANKDDARLEVQLSL